MTVIISRGSVSWLRWSVFLVPACVSLSACSKHHRSTPPPSASAAPSASAPTTAELADVPAEPSRWGSEAERGRIKPTDPLLIPARHLVAGHFGGKLPAELHYQSAELATGVRAVLLSDPAGSTQPLLLALGPHHKVIWTRKHPLGGIVPGFREVTLAAGPRGDAALFWYNEPSATVATRMWDVEGGLLMDAQVMEIDGCAALSVFYWPHRGYVVAAARRSSFVVQLLADNGDREFGAQGKTVAYRWRSAAPVSIAADTPDSVMLFHLGYLELSPNSASSDHLFAHRFDAHGTPLWRGPLDAGRLPGRVADESVRVRVHHDGLGTVLASLPESAAGGHFEVEVRSAGTAQLR